MRRTLSALLIALGVCLLAVAASELVSQAPTSAEVGASRVELLTQPSVSLEGMSSSSEVARARWYAWAAAQPPPPPPAPRWSADWDGIAECETGGDWTMTGPSFSGGVGFYNGTWNAFGGREFAPLAGQATKAEQIIVAERVYARYGLSGWGCRAYG